jgi:prevent-host-death family protein
MKKVGSRELKNRLGRYLRMVKRGETLVITERNRPVAQLVSTDNRSRGAASLEKTLQTLAEAGNLRLATKRLKRIVPVAAKGKPASRMILEDRR